MPRHLFATAALLALLTTSGMAQTAPESPSGTTGTTSQAGTSAANMPQITEASEFVKQAAAGGEYEIQSSKLALKHVRNDQLKSAAQKLIDDHTAAGKELKQTVKSSQVKAKIPAKLDQKHQAMMDELKQAKQDAFERIYLDQQLAAHRDAIALFSGYAEAGDNDALKQFAEAKLPVLQEHQQMLSNLESTMPSQ